MTKKNVFPNNDLRPSKKRKPIAHRETSARKIRAWLIAHGITQTSIAKQNGVSCAMVANFINGRSTSFPLFRYFISIGCPMIYFQGRRETREEK